ncbi:hypothetical protein [uncultured Ruminococcus sp.]|uniref:hypothetical protein n=1 Tax=uncultured Ruminococcus sp. TaxID=165186 RepID=UPI0026660086|nr:hypothetical protein [uncultured Ruminococcus sp.]
MNSVTMCDGCVAVLGGGKITVTIDADRHSKSLAECAESAFSKAALCPSESAKPACRLHF